MKVTFEYNGFFRGIKVQMHTALRFLFARNKIDNHLSIPLRHNFSLVCVCLPHKIH